METTIDWKPLYQNSFTGVHVLVTGGAGFIGSHLAGALTELGASVAVLDDLSTGRRENLARLAEVNFHHGSILDRDAVARAIAGARYVFHEAAMASVPMSVERPRDFYDVNVTGTLNVLEAARDARVQRVLFAASSSAYGDSETLPKVETMPAMPLSPYASSKVAGEGLMRAWANCYDLDTVSLRYFNIFGPRQSADSAYAAVIAAFPRALLAGKRPTIFGDGQQSRDFTFVANVVHANLRAARCEQALGGEVFNIACGERNSLNALATSMRQLLNRPELTPLYQPPRAGDVKHSLADLSRARAALDYQPIVDFEDGLRQTLDWYRDAL